MKRQWVVLWSLWAARLLQQPTREVRTSSGLVRGRIALDGSHAHFLSIPYATVRPRHRFKAAGPAPSWDGVFEAINENVRCPQRKGKAIVIGQENCLILNIFSPVEAWPGSRLPVMVFIHGGGFYDGSASRHLYGPQYITHKGVILVTVNYRLNIQGFACLHIKEAPGNAGLKDQAAALNWIRRNIKEFGGDPDNVTIFGESAGAASVSFHILSKMSKGLFHKAILQSGSSFSPWAFQYRPVYMASLLTKVMGHEAEEAGEIYKILNSKSDAELIVTRVPRLEGNVILSECLYVPCVEETIDGVEPFLTDYPHNIYRRGDYNRVPMMFGINSEEGFLFAALENDTTVRNIRIDKSLPKDLSFPTEEKRKEVVAKVESFYFPNNSVPNNFLLNIAKFQGDAYFANAVLEETEHVIRTSEEPVYSYLFNYNGHRNFAKLLSGAPYSSAPGATHGDELFYLFSQGFAPSLFEDKMIDRITTLWTNFAKFGDPTPAGSDRLPFRWHPTNSTTPRALLIDEEISSTPLRHSASLRYWQSIYSKYRRKSSGAPSVDLLGYKPSRSPELDDVCDGEQRGY